MNVHLPQIRAGVDPLMMSQKLYRFTLRDSLHVYNILMYVLFPSTSRDIPTRQQQKKTHNSHKVATEISCATCKLPQE